jgi:hypothetical protein
LYEWKITHRTPSPIKDCLYLYQVQVLVILARLLSHDAITESLENFGFIHKTKKGG